MTPALKLLGLRQPRRPTPTSRLERLSHRTGPQVSERPALSELRSVVHFRVLVAEMNAIQLTAEARGLVNDPARAPRLPLLQRMLESGRLQVRAAPLAGWSPDFTVFADAAGPSAVLTGFHWFERPYPHRGPALSSLHFAEAAKVASRRHEELWGRAHDIGPAVWSILSKAQPPRTFVGAGPG